jgi:hypothetical protein
MLEHRKLVFDAIISVLDKCHGPSGIFTSCRSQSGTLYSTLHLEQIETFRSHRELGHFVVTNISLQRHPNLPDKQHCVTST